MRALSLLLPAVDPGVTPNENFPIIRVLRDLAGSFVTIMIVICVVALVAGTGLLIFAKATGSSRVSDRTSGAVVWVLVGAMVIGSASGLIAWFSALPIGF